MAKRNRRNRRNNPSMDVGLNMNEVVRERLKKPQRPFVESPMLPESQQTELENIIAPLEDVVDSGRALDDNKFIKETDRFGVDDIINEFTSTPILFEEPPAPVSINESNLSSEDAARLLLEEELRRTISDERRRDLDESFKDETQRRIDFETEIELMRSEFKLYLKEAFPNITGNRDIKNGTEETLKSETKTKKQKNRNNVKQLQKNKVARLQREKKRKQQEASFKINKLKEKEVQTFFEEEIIIEQREKIERNPEIEKLNSVQRQIKEVKEMEIRMGRTIVPHRDIVESEESDFDSNTYTSPDDILIKPDNMKRSLEQQRKAVRMEVLRNELNSNRNEEEDYISTLK